MLPELPSALTSTSQVSLERRRSEVYRGARPYLKALLPELRSVSEVHHPDSLIMRNKGGALKNQQ